MNLFIRKINSAPKAKQSTFQKPEKSSGLRTHETSIDEKQQSNKNDHNQFLQDLIKQDLSKISKHFEEQGEESSQMQPVNGSKVRNYEFQLRFYGIYNHFQIRIKFIYYLLRLKVTVFQICIPKMKK